MLTQEIAWLGVPASYGYRDKSRYAEENPSQRKVILGCRGNAYPRQKASRGCHDTTSSGGVMCQRGNWGLHALDSMLGETHFQLTGSHAITHRYKVLERVVLPCGTTRLVSLGSG